MSELETSNVRVHELKCWPEFFAALEDGSKTFELRKDDRGFHAGDTLVLREWNHVMETYTGNELRRTVSYVLSGPVFGLMKGWVAMGLQHETPPALDAGKTKLAITMLERFRDGGLMTAQDTHESLLGPRDQLLQEADWFDHAAKVLKRSLPLQQETTVTQRLRAQGFERIRKDLPDDDIPEEKAAAPQCIYRDGCLKPETCAAQGHCDGPLGSDAT